MGETGASICTALSCFDVATTVLNHRDRLDELAPLTWSIPITVTV